MADYVYPSVGQLDQPDFLAQLLGSFWQEVFPDRGIIRLLLKALGKLEEQAVAGFQDLLDSMSRYTMPPLQVRDWVSVPLYASQMTQAGAVYSWPLPAGLVTVPLLCNRLTEPSLTLTNNVDYSVAAGVIAFNQNPFNGPGTPAPVLTDGVVTDTVVQLWAYRAGQDASTIYEQFGYPLTFLPQITPSSDNYKRLINGLWSAIVRGSTRRAIDLALSAMTDVEMTRGTETVTDIFVDGQHLWVCTDQHAYAFHPAATALVAVGDVVQAGQALADTLQIFSLANGQIPPGLAGLEIPTTMLPDDYLGALTFQNTTVPWDITTDAHGHTYMSFPIVGLPADVTRFWNEVHFNGLQYGWTLARLLDTRPRSYVEHREDSFSTSAHESFSVVEEEEPTVASLPTTVNPLQFLIANILRNNAFVAVMHVAHFGPNALGLQYVSALRQIVPPQTALFLVYVDALILPEGYDVVLPGTTDPLNVP